MILWLAWLALGSPATAQGPAAGGVVQVRAVRGPVDETLARWLAALGATSPVRSGTGEVALSTACALGDGALLTVAHGLRGAWSVEVSDGGAWVPAEVVRIDLQADLAVLRAPMALPAWSWGAARVGDPVRLIGHADGGDAVTREGRWLGEDDARIPTVGPRSWGVVDVPVTRGMSGGAAARGSELVGLVGGGRTAPDEALVQPAATVRAWLATDAPTPTATVDGRLVSVRAPALGVLPGHPQPQVPTVPSVTQVAPGIYAVLAP